MFDIQTASIVIAATSVVAGVTFYIFQVRHQNKIRQTEIETRQANLLIQIYNYYYKEDFLNTENEILFQWKWKDFDDFWQKYGLSLRNSEHACGPTHTNGSNISTTSCRKENRNFNNQKPKG